MGSAVASGSDRDLVERARAGNRAAVGSLVERHQRRAVSLAYRLLNNIEDAQDVAQNAMTKAFSRLGDLEDLDRFESWLLRIVANLSLNERRSRQRRRTISIHEDDDSEGAGDGIGAALATADDEADAGLISSERGVRLRAALDCLPENHRMAFILHVQENLPQKEIAEMLGITVENVKFRIFKARAKLRELLADLL